MRAVVADLLQGDRSVAGEQVAGVDGPRTGLSAVGAGARLLGIAGLLSGALLTEAAGDGPAGVVGPLLQGGEVDVGSGALGAEALEGEELKEALDFGVVGEVRGRGSEHGGSSLTEASCPGCAGPYQNTIGSAIDVSTMSAAPATLCLHPSTEAHIDRKSADSTICRFPTKVAEIGA